MSLFLNITLDGLTQGMIFAALALSLVLIFRATRIINFAQGAMAMITTFIASSLLNRGLGYWWAFLAALAIGFLLGALVERVLIRPLEGKPELNPVIVTIGLVIVLEGLAGAVYGNSSRGFPAAFSQSGLVVGHTEIAFSHFDLFIAAAVLLLMAAILVLFRATTLGLRMRASAFCARGVEVAWSAGREASHLRVGTGRSGRSAGRLVDGTYEFLRAVFHGPRADLRVHRRGHRWAREPGRCPGWRIDHRAVHFVRWRLPRVRAGAARGARFIDGHADGSAAGDILPALGPGRLTVAGIAPADVSRADVPPAPGDGARPSPAPGPAGPACRRNH